MPQARVTGRRVLLVDDEPFVLTTMRMLLAVDEHQVVEADSPAKALETFAHEKFDLVVTDFDMPEMNGNELAARIKQMAPEQRIILITAYPRRIGDRNPAVDAVLTKPFSFEVLREAISNVLSAKPDPSGPSSA